MINTNFRTLATTGITTLCVTVAGLFSGILAGTAPARASMPSPAGTLTTPAQARIGPAVSSPAVSSPAVSSPGVSNPAVSNTAAHNNALYGVSCTKWTQCLAVGTRAAGSATSFRPLSEQWNGRRWKVIPMPWPGERPESLITAISCHSAGRCVATGYHYGDSGQGYAPLAEQWNGKSWHIIEFLSPATTPQAFLNDVSCQAFAGCLAVGGSTGQNGQGKAIAERWTGGRWHVARVPQPSGAVATQLVGISCTGRDCVAVGMYVVASGRMLALAERWNGRSWHLLPAASDAGPLSELNEVSCHAATLCMAVGDSDWTQLRPLTELWEHGRWRLVSGGQVAGGTLSGISCPDLRWCSAVGLAGSRPLTEVWSGKRWRVVPAPWAPGRPANELSQLSCRTGSARCVTVGARYRPDSSAGEATLAEWWNGRSWHLMATPNP
jgi:hypothetical protein